MISLNGNILIANPTNLIDKFSIDGRNIDLLSDCNMQEFKYIDGCGSGWFLIKYNAVVGNEVTLQLNTGERTLIVTDSIIIQHDTAPALKLIRTRELKYKLESYTITRNYNVINTLTVDDNGGDLVTPDNSSRKTAKEIIESVSEDIQVIWSGRDIIPYNFFVDRLSLRDAIDLLCKAYGLLWTVEYAEDVTGSSSSVGEGNKLTVFIFEGVALELNSTIASDINKPNPILPYKEVTTIYPYLDVSIYGPISYYNRTTTGIGSKVIEAYNPYFPAIIYRGSSTLANTTEITEVHDYVKENLIKLCSRDYFYHVQNTINFHDPFLPPKATRYVYGHNMTGFRTISMIEEYPVLKTPTHKVQDKQAKNIVGALSTTYNSYVAGFYVTPAYGLDGDISSLGEVIYVVNLYQWNHGVAGATIRIEWDEINKQWIPLQQEYECPDSDELIEEPPLPVETYPPFTLS